MMSRVTRFRCAVAGLALAALTFAAAAPGASPRDPTACPANEFALWSERRLHGVNVFMGRNPDGGPGGFGDGQFTQADFTAISDQGGNYVHISHAGLFAEQPPYAPDLAAQANLDRVLAMVRKAGLYAVIGFRSGPGRNENAITDRDGAVLEDIWTSASAQDAWVAMVRYAAARYAADPTVVGIAPMVEPNAYARRGFPSPEEFYRDFGNTLEDYNGLAARSTTAIRAVDRQTPILLEPDGFARVAWLPYLRVTGDRRTVYTVHDYEPFAYTNQNPPGGTYPGRHQVDGRTVLVNREFLRDRLAQVASFGARNRVPIAITEFGVKKGANNAALYLSDRISAQNPVGSWAVWVWQPAGFNDPFSVRDRGSRNDVLHSAWATNCRPAFADPRGTGPMPLSLESLRELFLQVRTLLNFLS